MPKKGIVRPEVARIIKELPGITAAEIAEFIPGQTADTISAALSVMYRRGGYRREQEGYGYRYWCDDSAPPPVVPRKVNTQTEAGARAECVLLREKVAELEAWKADAIARFPTLAVPPLVLKAREIVAEEYRASGDTCGAKEAVEGKRDHTMLIKAVVRSLELAA